MNAVDYNVNSPDSPNRLIEAFVDRIHRSLYQKKTKIFPQDLEKKISKSLTKLTKSALSIQESIYFIKGIILSSESIMEKEYNSYQKKYSAAIQQIALIHSEYTDFVASLPDGSKESVISFFDTQQDAQLIYNRLKNSGEVSYWKTYQGNPNSFIKILSAQSQKNDDVVELFDRIKETLNLKNNGELAEFVGIKLTSVQYHYSRNGKITSDLLDQIKSRHGYAEASEAIIAFFSKSQQLGTNKDIIEKYKEIVKSVTDYEELATMSSKLLKELMKRNAVTYRQAATISGISQSTFSKYLRKGIRTRKELDEGRSTVSLSMQNQICSSIESLSESEVSEVILLFNGVTEKKNADALIMNPNIGSKEFANTMFQQSCMSLKEYSEYLGIEKRTLQTMLKGEVISRTLADKIRDKFKISEPNYMPYIQKMTVERKSNYSNYLNYLEEKLETASLKEIRGFFGIERREVELMMSASSTTVKLYESQNMIPDNKLPSALQAYQIPKYLEGRFKDRFAKGQKTFDWSHKVENQPRTGMFRSKEDK